MKFVSQNQQIVAITYSCVKVKMAASDLNVFFLLCIDVIKFSKMPWYG
jgi:hypothetical protein